jgi:GTP-binding protein
VLRQAVTASPPPMRQNRRPKIFYATQVATNPPTVVLFTNGPDLLDNTYLRYLLNTFRDQLPFGEVAIKLHVRHRNREDQAPTEELETAGPADVAADGKAKRKRPARKAPGTGKKGKHARKGRESGLWSDV